MAETYCDDFSMEQPEQAGGNMINPGTEPKKRPYKSRKWVFTYNNPLLEPEQMEQFLKSRGWKYFFQTEKGAETGTIHYQGFIECKNPIVRPKEPWFWEGIKGTIKQNIVYCSKDKTKIAGPWFSNEYAKDIPEALDVIKVEDMNENQLKWKAMIEAKPEKRKIYWIYDEIGGAGKTDFAKWAAVNVPYTIILGGKANDAFYGISQFVEKQGKVHAVIFDFPRCLDGGVSYEALEKIKDGLFFNTKYESGMCIYNPPHVICFANWAPRYGAVSLDRWQVESLRSHEQGSASPPDGGMEW